jgi:hypothetical protein
MTLSITTLCIECHYAEYLVSFFVMMNVIMLYVVIPNVVMLSVVIPNVVILSAVMLSVIMLSVSILSVIMLSVHYGECQYSECRYTKCCYAECRYAECHYAECRYTECRCAECRGALYTSCQVKVKTSCQLRQDLPYLARVVVAASTQHSSLSLCHIGRLMEPARCWRESPGARAQCYKTFFVRNLLIFLIS